MTKRILPPDSFQPGGPSTPEVCRSPGAAEWRRPAEAATSRGLPLLERGPRSPLPGPQAGTQRYNHPSRSCGSGETQRTAETHAECHIFHVLAIGLPRQTVAAEGRRSVCLPQHPITGGARWGPVGCEVALAPI